jgi:hypothetical protein
LEGRARPVVWFFDVEKHTGHAGAWPQPVAFIDPVVYVRLHGGILLRQRLRRIYIAAMAPGPQAKVGFPWAAELLTLHDCAT